MVGKSSFENPDHNLKDAERFSNEVLNSLQGHLESLSGNLNLQELTALNTLIQFAGTDRKSLLAKLPPEALLNKTERHVFDKVMKIPLGEEPLTINHLVVVMKATRLCNLRCTYCHSWKEGPGQVMTFEVLCKSIHSALTSGASSVEFVWHGGEVTLLPLAFYRHAAWLQEQFRQPGQVIENALQTNATVPNQPLYSFFQDYGFHVGISLDGPPEIHDLRRLDKAGRPTSKKVREGIKLLRSLGMPVAVLVVVDESVVDLGARRMLESLCELEVDSAGFLNMIPRNLPSPAGSEDKHIPWPLYIDYLCNLFEEWNQFFKNRVSIREFEDLMQGIERGKTAMCYFAGNCMGRFVTIEPNGDVAACDKYVEDEDYKFGNVRNKRLAEILLQSRKLENHTHLQSKNMAKMKKCPWFFVCQGGCPHDYRLNVKYLFNFQGNCCGYRPLLEKMAKNADEPASLDFPQTHLQI